jgi:cytochrome c553
MKKLFGLALALANASSWATSTHQADQLNQRCAPCHGLYGQGAPGSNAPRLAGLPSWYLSKASKDYLKGARKNPLMLEVSGMEEMTDQEINTLAEWLSKQDVAKDPTYDIKMLAGNSQEGQKKFEADCKDCHAKDGYGKKKKDAPPLAGQHPGYITASIKAFFRKDRYHDDDPIDDTFDDISDAQVRDILTWMAELDNHKQQKDYQFQATPLPVAIPDNLGYRVNSVQQMITTEIAPKTLSMAQAIAAMRAKATELEVPIIPKQTDAPTEWPIAMDLKFCAPQHISKLIEADPIMANYDPCRVTLVKNPGEGLHLITINLDMLINGKQLPPEAQRIAIQVNQDMLAIISAGAKGENKTVKSTQE